MISKHDQPQEKAGEKLSRPSLRQQLSAAKQTVDSRESDGINSKEINGSSAQVEAEHLTKAAAIRILLPHHVRSLTPPPHDLDPSDPISSLFENYHPKRRLSRNDACVDEQPGALCLLPMSLGGAGAGGRRRSNFMLIEVPISETGDESEVQASNQPQQLQSQSAAGQHLPSGDSEDLLVTLAVIESAHSMMPMAAVPDEPTMENYSRDSEGDLNNGPGKLFDCIHHMQHSFFKWGSLVKFK